MQIKIGVFNKFQHFKSKLLLSEEQIAIIEMDDRKTLSIINPSNKNVCSVRKSHDKKLVRRKEEYKNGKGKR